MEVKGNKHRDLFCQGLGDHRSIREGEGKAVLPSGIMELAFLREPDCLLSPRTVQFSSSVMSNSLRPHRLQHTRLPCPSPTPGAYSTHKPLPTLFLDNISSAINGNTGLGRFQTSVKAKRKLGKARN